MTRERGSKAIKRCGLQTNPVSKERQSMMKSIFVQVFILVVVSTVFIACGAETSNDVNDVSEESESDGVCSPDCDDKECNFFYGEYCGECDLNERCLQGSCIVLDDSMALIPAGSFMMGCNSPIDDHCDSSENPYHEVNVSEFEIDITEVTVAQYRACVEDDGRCFEPLTYPYCNWGVLGRYSHPVNCIHWDGAKTYCRWAGKRLCSEAEWEKAARGTDGRIYPWGNEEATCDRAVMSNNSIYGYGCGDVRTWPVGLKPAGIYGLYDMAGNVWEWVEDDKHYNYEGAPDDGNAWLENNIGPGVLRGGGFRNTSVSLRASNRYTINPDHAVHYLGVRCCR